jgi:dihydrofolate reductase
VQVLGSNQLVQTLIRHGLVGEDWLVIHPLMLGKGKQLLGEIDHPVRRRQRTDAARRAPA